MDESRRKQLDGIVSQMVSNKESDSSIQFVVDDFKSKYSSQKSQVEQQKDARRAKGLPVSVRDDRAEPTLLGSMVRGVAGLGMKVASVAAPFVRNVGTVADGTANVTPESEYWKPVRTDFLGDTSIPGARGMQTLNNAQSGGDILKGATQATASLGGTAAEIASYGVGGGAVKGVLARAGLETLKQGAISGALGLGGAELTNSIERGDSAANVVANTVIMAAGGGLAGGITAGATHLAGKALEKTIVPKTVKNITENLTSSIQKAIKPVFKKGTAEQLAQDQARHIKGMRLLDKMEIDIPDGNGGLTRFDPKQLTDTNTFEHTLPAITAAKKQIFDKMDNLLDSTDNNVDMEPVKDYLMTVFGKDAKTDVESSVAHHLYSEIERMAKTNGNQSARTVFQYLQAKNLEWKPQASTGTLDAVSTKVGDLLAEQIDKLVGKTSYRADYSAVRSLETSLAKVVNAQTKNSKITREAIEGATNIGLLSDILLADFKGAGRKAGYKYVLQNAIKKNDPEHNLWKAFQYANELNSGPVKKTAAQKLFKPAVEFIRKNVKAPVDNAVEKPFTMPSADTLKKGAIRSLGAGTIMGAAKVLSKQSEEKKK